MLKLVLENLIPILFTIFTPPALMLASKLIKAAAKKWHLEGVLVYDDKVNALVETGVMALEKASLNAVKNNQPPTPGEVKLKSVIDFVNSQLAQHNLPQKAGEALTKIVDAKLMKLEQDAPALTPEDPALPPPLPPPPVSAPTPTVVTGK